MWRARKIKTPNTGKVGVGVAYIKGIVKYIYPWGWGGHDALLSIHASTKVLIDFKRRQ